MIVALTGATGFVGKQIQRALIARGAKVRPIALAGEEALFTDADGLDRVVTTDNLFGESAEWSAGALAGVDVLVHAAWYVEPGQYLLSDLNTTCLIGSLNLAQGAIEAGVRRMIGIGTCFEYDVSYGMLSTDTPLRPTTPYASAKAATYIHLSQLLPRKGIEFAWCRLFYLYGENEDQRRLVPYLRDRLSTGEIAELTSGNQIRDFLDVADAGRQVADIALGNGTGAVNVCSGVPITVRQLAETIADEYDRRDLLRFGARPDNVVDPPCVVGVRTTKSRPDDPNPTINQTEVKND